MPLRFFNYRENVIIIIVIIIIISIIIIIIIIISTDFGITFIRVTTLASISDTSTRRPSTPLTALGYPLPSLKITSRSLRRSPVSHVAASSRKSSSDTSWLLAALAATGSAAMV